MLKPEDVMGLAVAAQLERPKMIARKLLSGQVSWVLRYGPDDAREEKIFPQTMSLADAEKMIPQNAPNQG